MKKFTRVCLILCCVLAALGLVLAIIGATMGFGVNQFIRMADEGRFNFGTNELSFGSSSSLENGESMGDDEEWKSTAQTWSADEVGSLDIEFDFGTLILEPSHSDKLEISAEYRSIWNDYSRKLSWKMDGDTLEIKDSLDDKILKLFSLGNDDATLRIGIPEGKVFEELSMEIGAADVQIETGLMASEIEIILGAGDLTGDVSEAPSLKSDRMKLDIGAGHMAVTGVWAKELDLDCGAGEIELYESSTQNLDADCGVGSMVIEMLGKVTDYNYEVDCGIGEVVVGENSYNGLGETTKIQNGSENTMDIECGVGEIRVSFTE